jgi:hypothetical protein
MRGHTNFTRVYRSNIRSFVALEAAGIHEPTHWSYWLVLIILTMLGACYSQMSSLATVTTMVAYVLVWYIRDAKYLLYLK